MTLAIRHLALATAMLAAAAGGEAFGQAPAPASDPQSQANASADQPKTSVRTGKERLGQKWSDEQRIDDCGVPAEMRGRGNRPDCPEPAR
jgi:hypothetical protein